MARKQPEIIVQLIPHIIEEETSFGTVEKFLNQFYVLASTVDAKPRQVGWIGSKQGEEFACLTGFPPSLVETVSTKARIERDKLVAERQNPTSPSQD